MCGLKIVVHEGLCVGGGGGKVGETWDHGSERDSMPNMPVADAKCSKQAPAAVNHNHIECALSLFVFFFFPFLPEATKDRDLPQSRGAAALAGGTLTQTLTPVPGVAKNVEEVQTTYCSNLAPKAQDEKILAYRPGQNFFSP